MFDVIQSTLQFLRDRLAQYLAWAMIVIGFAIVVVCLFLKFGISGQTMLNIGLTVGTAMLSGGVFTWLTKTAQIRGVFREDMESIVYSTQHAFVRKDVEKLWANVTRALHSDAFSGIESKIYEAIRKSYLPTNSDFYYQNVARTMKLEVVDFEKQIVDIEVFMEACLIPNKTKTKIERKYAISIDGTKEKLGLPSLSSTLLDKNKERAIMAAEGVVVGEDAASIECVLSDIPTQEPLVIQDRLRFKQCLLQDNVLMWRAVSYVDGIKITIQNVTANRLVVQHRGVGKVTFRREEGVSGTLVLSAPDLIFAGQGIMLTMQIAPEESSDEQH